MSQPATDAAAAQPGGESEGRRKRRNRWGSTSGADPTEGAAAGDTAPADAGTAKKKRKSRWEEPEESKELSVVSHIPKELVLPGGIKVRSFLTPQADLSALHSLMLAYQKEISRP